MTARPETHGPYLVAALYHFARFPRFKDFQSELQAVCVQNDVHGTLLLAHEGINGTIAGSDAGIGTQGKPGVESAFSADESTAEKRDRDDGR